MSNTLLSVQDVAKRLGVTDSCIRQWTHKRRIPYVKLGGFLRFDPAIIDAWIADRSVPAQLPPVKGL